ncbi:VAM7 [Paramicrosporidium saccamoebae]|uniref:VAM7 n=1 Tax=Paramicrosporidium saccamoebae TaxID=1246581 RepID=A0A2H9TK77_9FUNG|nr:VAM7 [Paramicrosporidium saccamoebae]
MARYVWSVIQNRSILNSTGPSTRLDWDCVCKVGGNDLSGLASGLVAITSDLQDSTGAEWNVYRRYSDFQPFDVQVRKILPNLNVALPAREMLRPLAGMLGWKTSEPSAEFLDLRRKGLDEYVRRILAVAGGNRTALWNHPVVLTFFDIPSVVQRSSPASVLNCPVPFGEWEMELEKAETLLAEALNTKERAENTASRGHDTSNYMKHLKRQISTTRKLTEKLQMALDFYARVDKVDDDRLSELTKKFQLFAGQVELLIAESDSNASSSTIPCKYHSGMSNCRSSGESSRSGPIARTPVRVSSLNSTVKSTPPKKRPDESLLDSQISAIKSQDSQLSELSSIIQRHKSLGETIGHEIGKIDREMSHCV